MTGRNSLFVFFSVIRVFPVPPAPPFYFLQQIAKALQAGTFSCCISFPNSGTLTEIRWLGARRVHGSHRAWRKTLENIR